MRTLKAIALFPGRIPRITYQAVEQAMKACEWAGVIFVVLMIAAMSHPSSFLTGLCVICAVVFFSLIIFVKLRDYQILLDENEFLL